MDPSLPPSKSQQNQRHNARNIGTDDAVLDISFSSADRKVVGE